MDVIQMKVRIQFVLKETGECVLFETELDDNVKAHEFIFIVNPANDDKYVYAIGGTKIWKPNGNVLCAEEVALLSLRIECEFE